MHQIAQQIHIRRGLDIPIAGKPKQVIETGSEVSQVALSGLDYQGLKPRLQVTQGDRVRLGQCLFTNRRDPAIQFVSPGSGIVQSVNRGARRVLESVVVELDGSQEAETVFPVHSESAIANLSRNDVAACLQASGLWTAFRTRPYCLVPHSESAPRSLFVTAIDTNPLAPDPRVVVSGRENEFAAGLGAIAQLTAGTVWLCTAPGWSEAIPEVERLVHAVFDGPHPAGLPGTHIHFLDPVGPGQSVWHIGYQDVLAIGQLILTGQVPTSRITALGGQLVTRPRLVATRNGASIKQLLDGELLGVSKCRIISGSALNGRNAAGKNHFLGRYHNQVTVIEEGGKRKFFGWSGLLNRGFTASGNNRKSTGHTRQHDFSTARNGRFSGMLPMRVFERLMPLDILPSPLFRALLVMDTDQAQALGCLELAEEDLALCSFACPAKTDYGGALRATLEHIEKHG